MDYSKQLEVLPGMLAERSSNREGQPIQDELETFAADPPLPQKSAKCAKAAEVYRNNGNDKFKMGSYEDAAITYTHSIRTAPPYSECIALAYANRSAALYHLELYEECILDIERALDLPYPHNLRAKIISRKDAALSNIKRAASSSQGSKSSPTIVDDLKLAHGENAHIPGASRGIEIVYRPADGRKLVANMHFEAGDVLLIEKPYFMVLVRNQDKNQPPIYCCHCLKKSFCLIPCDKCTVDVYCSEKCRSDAYDSYHRIECSIQYTLMCASPLDTQVMLNLLRCLNILTEQGNNLSAINDELQKIIIGPLDPARIGFTDSQFVGSTRKAFIGALYKKPLTVTPNCLSEHACIAVLLRNYTDFFQANSDILEAAKKLLILRTALNLNNLSVYSYGSLDIIANAAYPLLRLAKHGCFNNTILYHEKDSCRVVLRASKKIKPGDEILFNHLSLSLEFKEETRKSGKFRGARRVCTQCDETYVYPLKKYSPIKMDETLCLKLKKDPYNIEGLWELLNLVNGDPNLRALPVQVIKMMLVDAYEGRFDSLNAQMKFRSLGIE